MYNSLVKTASLLWLPALMLFLPIWFKSEAIEILRNVGIKPQLLFYTICAAGVFLSWRFNRSRILFALVALILSYAFISAVGGKGQAVEDNLVSLVIGTLLAINFFWIVLVPEQGVFSNMGKLAVFIFAAEAGAVLLVLSAPTLAPLLHQIQSFKSALITIDMPLSLVTLALLGVATFIIFIRTVVARSEINAGLLTALLAAAYGIVNIGESQAEALFFATAALILQVTIIRDSHARVYTDDLTGLPARRALDEQLMRLGKQYVIAMVDIDNFKKFNDKYGHDVGDQTLRFIAAQLRYCKGRAQVFRYGGEEFTLLFRGKTLTEVWTYIDQIRARIENARFTIRGSDRPKDKPHSAKKNRFSKTLSVTVSIGAAQRDAEHRHYSDVIKAADEQLFNAKNAGRNRTAMTDFG